MGARGGRAIGRRLRDVLRAVTPGLLLLAGCVAVDEGRPIRERQAEAATARGDWLLAGSLWFQLYEEDGGANARAGFETARALHEQGDAPGALRLAESVIARYPDEIELYVLSAEIQMELGSAQAAAESLERALALDPSRTDVLARLGEARYAAGRWAAAIGPLHRAVTAGERPRELAWLAALAAERCGDRVGAFADYREALGSPESTAEELVKGARLAEDAEVRAAEPLALPVAIGWLERACELEPQQVEAHYRLGRYLRESGRREEAVQRLWRAAEIDPTGIDTLTELASLYAEAGDTARALEFAARALALEPSEEERQALEAIESSVHASETEPGSEDESSGGG